VPRGDGRQSGERRPSRTRLSIGDYIPRGLARRRLWWENFGAPGDPNKITQAGENLKYTNYDGILDYRRPGSQKK
jgi:hypothetical protein